MFRVPNALEASKAEQMTSSFDPETCRVRVSTRGTAITITRTGTKELSIERGKETLQNILTLDIIYLQNNVCQIMPMYAKMVDMDFFQKKQNPVLQCQCWDRLHVHAAVREVLRGTSEPKSREAAQRLFTILNVLAGLLQGSILAGQAEWQNQNSQTELN